MDNIDEHGKVYLEIVIMEFLNISNESLKKFFNIEKESNQAIARTKTFNVKSYHKNDKNRIQAVYKEFNECEKLILIAKIKKGHFIENSDYLF